MELIYFVPYGEICRRIHWASGEAYGLTILAGVAAARGDYSLALESASEAFTVARRIGHSQWMAASLHSQVALYREILAHEAARPILEQVLSTAYDTGSANWITQISAEAAYNPIQRRRLDEAQALLDRAAPPGGPALTLGQRNLWMARALLAVARGQFEQAHAHLDHLEQTRRGGAGECVSIYISLVRGNALAVQNNWSAAAAELAVML